MLRNMRTRRAVRAAEKKSGIKQEDAIFRGKPNTSTRQLEIQPTLSMTNSEDSDAVVSHLNFETELCDYGEDSGTLIQGHAHAKEIHEKEKEIAQMMLAAVELVEKHEEALAEKDAALQESTDELSRTRQDFLEAIVEISAREHELGTTRLQLVAAHAALADTNGALRETKTKLYAVSAALIQHQHRLHEREEGGPHLAANLIGLGLSIFTGGFMHA